MCALSGMGLSFLKPPPHGFISQLMDSVIWNILIHHGEEEWLDKCRAALPGVSDGEILGVIQLYFCEDVEELLEE